VQLILAQLVDLGKQTMRLWIDKTADSPTASCIMQAAAAIFAQRRFTLLSKLQRASLAGPRRVFSTLVDEATQLGVSAESAAEHHKQRKETEATAKEALQAAVAASPFSCAAFDANERQV
jgi:protein-disulfide isomerase-like protein with CxxC motif